MIEELLLPGIDNARTADTLSMATGLTPRQVTQQIERERRKGAPICAACGQDGQHFGYYLAPDGDTVRKYCGRLQHRAGEIHKTRRALLRTAERMEKEKEGTGKAPGR